MPLRQVLCANNYNTRHTPSPPKLKSLLKQQDPQLLKPAQQQVANMFQSTKQQQQQQQQQFNENDGVEIWPVAKNKDITELKSLQPVDLVDQLKPLKPPQQFKLQPLPQQVSSAATAISRIPRLISEVEEEIEDIDKSTSRDAIFQATDIAKDIYKYMFDVEEAQSIKPDYLRDQKILTPRVRQRLVNWCIDIHSRLKLLQETLYMTVALIDRYFDRVTVERQSQVQLVAVGATLIASKYEEIYPPDVGDLIYLTNNAYSRGDIMRIEIDILQKLEFNLGKPIPLAFLRRFSKAAHCDLKMHSIAKFLMEISLTEYECSHWKPSLLAAAALYATIHILSPPTAQSNDNSNKKLSSLSATNNLNPLQSSTLTRNSIAGFGLTRRLALGPSTLMNKNSNSNNQEMNSDLKSKLKSITTTPAASSPTANSTPDRWNRTLVHYTTYTAKQLAGPASELCMILKKVQKNPQTFNCVQKNAQQLTKWPELKSSRVDALIRSSSTPSSA